MGGPYVPLKSYPPTRTQSLDDIELINPLDLLQIDGEFVIDGIIILGSDLIGPVRFLLAVLLCSAAAMMGAHTPQRGLRCQISHLS